MPEDVILGGTEMLTYRRSGVRSNRRVFPEVPSCVCSFPGCRQDICTDPHPAPFPRVDGGSYAGSVQPPHMPSFGFVQSGLRRSVSKSQLPDLDLPRPQLVRFYRFAMRLSSPPMVLNLKNSKNCCEKNNRNKNHSILLKSERTHN